MKRMMQNNRSIERLIAGIAATVCLAVPGAAISQAFPAKPLRMILAQGGGAEVLARLVAQKSGETLGQPVVLETQSGAGGAMGAQMVARAAPDGYTILFAASNSQIYHAFLSRSVLYDPIRDFTPITRVGQAVLCVVVNPAAPFATFPEFIDYARRNPGKVSFATSGIGTTHHLAAELIKQLAGIDMVHVPYKGGGQALTDLVGGQVPMAFTILATALPHIKAGKMKIIAVVNDKRYHTIPEVATLREMLPGFEMPPGWMGLFGPAGLTQPVQRRLNTELAKALNHPEVRLKGDELGMVMDTSTPEELAAELKRDVGMVGRIVKAADIQPE
jgi:tripartite-type tricarboxylate transporter receptor subunit TctC